MTPIGGYFGLELSKGCHHYHDTQHILKSGRSSLEHILTCLKPAVVHIPFYTCDSLLEPFLVTNIRYQFYGINEHLEPLHEIELKENEYYLYINYSDLKGDTVKRLSELYRDKLIVDCTQAFFMKGNGISWYFNSSRKFFGVPDGSYLYCPDNKELPKVDEQNENYITDHLLERFNGHVNEGYITFQNNEVLAGLGIARMSKLSEYLLSGINYDAVISIRRSNYDYLHCRLKNINRFKTTTCTYEAPMYYPLLLDKIINRAHFTEKGIYIPTFWRDTQTRGVEGFEFEKEMPDKMLTLPVDHRYTIADMEYISDNIIHLYNNCNDIS